MKYKKFRDEPSYFFTIPPRMVLDVTFEMRDVKMKAVCFTCSVNSAKFHRSDRGTLQTRFEWYNMSLN